MEGHGCVTAEVGVAEGTTQVTARETYEDSGTTCPPAFTLKRIEDLVDLVFADSHHKRYLGSMGNCSS